MAVLLQTSSPGSSKLAQQLIGLWIRAPKAARSEYEQFIKAIAGSLGGEISTDELQERAAAVWDTLQHAPSPEKLQLGRTSLAGAVRPYRQALQDYHSAQLVAERLTRLSMCRDILEKITGSSDDKTVMGILGKINSLRVGTPSCCMILQT